MLTFFPYIKCASLLFMSFLTILECCSEVSLEPSLLQIEQAQLPQPFFVAEVVQPSDHLLDHHLDPIQQHLSCAGCHTWMQHSIQDGAPTHAYLRSWLSWHAPSLEQPPALLQTWHLVESPVGAKQLEGIKPEKRSPQIAIKMQEEKQSTPKINPSNVFNTAAISRAVTSYLDDALGRSN